MDRGAQVDLQNKVIFSSELDFYLLHYIYSIKDLEIAMSQSTDEM